MREADTLKIYLNARGSRAGKKYGKVQNESYKIGNELWRYHTYGGRYHEMGIDRHASSFKSRMNGDHYMFDWDE